MPSLTLLESFATTAREGSFAGAGRRLGVSASAIGKAIQRLEDELGVTLFQRSTRHLELTEEGRLLLSGLSPALEALEEAIDEVRDRTERIAGPLVLTVPLAGAPLIATPLASFLGRFPEVTVEIRFADAMSDLVAEGVDLGIRNGPLRDSTLKLRRFLPYRHGLFAAPAYLERRGLPVLATLDGHDRIAFRLTATGRLQSWLHRDGTPLLLSSPRLVVSSIEGARHAAVAGLGVAWLPEFVVTQDLARGELVRVLEDEVQEAGEFYLVWPASRAMPRRLRALIDHLVAAGS